MNDSDGIWGWAAVIFIGYLVYSLFFSGPSDKEKLRTALEEANDQIAYCNDQIDSARDEAWDDYESMGDALDSLSNCEEISDPTE